MDFVVLCSEDPVISIMNATEVRGRRSLIYGHCTLVSIGNLLASPAGHIHLAL